ncbi:hypothetical protein LCGC14_1442300 [marine sediment metagenome]|uniref:C2H2-type domain-containing protein n=1 Tax=marine sediment metagenome TaxID=412755 RepID=A0A0F9MM88_9ZZZZ
MDLMQVVYAKVSLDEKLWKDHIDFMRNMEVPSWKEPAGFEWQYDGQQYGPLCPGETIVVPLEVAEHGLKASAIFMRKKDQYGKPTMDLDPMSGRHPMLVVQSRFMAHDPRQEEEMPAAPLAVCPLCQEEQADQEAFRAHLASKHSKVISEGVDESSPAALAMSAVLANK